MEISIENTIIKSIGIIAAKKFIIYLLFRYRELSKQWHPDKVRGEGKEEAQQKFLEIQAAYENLSNIKNR